MTRRIGGPGGGSDPGPKKGAGALVAAGAVAIAVAGGSAGALGLGGAATEGSSAADSLSAKDLNARKSEGKKSAQKGKADEAWNRMGLRSLKKALKRDLKCVASSTDRVREFFLRTPCSSLDRMLFAIGDGHGNSTVISVAWVGFRSRADAEAFGRVERVQGSGDITPLAGSLVDLAHIHFTGHHFDSRLTGTTMVIAEAETGTGRLSDGTLQAVAEVAVWLPRP